MNVPPARPETPTRRREAAAGAALALVAALLVGLVALVGSGGDAGRPAASPTSAPASSPAPAPVPPPIPDEGTPGGVTTPPAPSTGPADALAPLLPAVALDAPASGDDGVSAEVVSLEAVDGTGSGVGNVAGPALRVTVRLAAGTAGPVVLDLVGVTLAHGADQTPASPLDDPSAAPLTGPLAPGSVAEGVYVFSVPEDARELVTLTVGYRADAPYLVFTGAAP
ncbi:hypothetical protein [Geodermatophilus amargosae]|uniref:hypothetical protein n=1 Tax=Geodermatophilus amargosae TaxID=1296565 RepID=UPI0034DE6DCD